MTLDLHEVLKYSLQHFKNMNLDEAWFQEFLKIMKRPF